MLQLLPRLIVIGLAAAVSPVAVMVLISLMLKKHPVRNSSLFLLGFALVLIAIGIAGIILLHFGGHAKKSPVDGYIDIALGVLCLLAIPLAWKRKRKQEEPAARDIKPARAFTLGGATMLVNFSTIPIYVSGVHVISDARLGLFDDVLAMVILTAVTLITLVVPIVIYIVFPKAAARALSSVRVWLSKHQKVIGAAILLVFGVYLLIKGIHAVV